MASALLKSFRETLLEADLFIGREGIRFWNKTSDRMVIEIEVHNLGTHRSTETILLVQSAPLGAFVPWQPLAHVAVPAIQAGRSTTVRLEATAPLAAALPPDRRTPAQLLTALDQQEPYRRRRTPRPATGRAWPGLASDLLQRLGGGGVHFAGNLNVFVGHRSVERHLAQALRIYPGRDNLAMFVVGSGPDAYSFEIHGAPIDWKASLLRPAASEASLLDLGNHHQVEVRQWVTVACQELMMLLLQPPTGCTSGKVDVKVCQRSTGREAIVEFSLDPSAAGAGCFTV
jgi:hypothetical protein